MNYLHLDQVIHSDTPITREQADAFLDSFIALVESYGWSAGGSLSGPLTEKQIEERLDE